MSLPSIKFASFTVSYLAFIAMLVASNLQYKQDQKNRINFSQAYATRVNNYTAYVSNPTLKYRFKPDNFFIRKDMPMELDIAICIWVVGRLTASVDLTLVSEFKYNS